jgi:cell division protein FtsL
MSRNEARSGSILTILFVSLLAAALLGSVIYSLDKRNTMYNKVSAMNEKLDSAEAENVRLQSELDSKMSAKNIEEYAQSLGMVKLNSSQIFYVKTQTGDVVTIPEQEKGLIAKIKSLFDKCVEYFRG